MHVPMSKHPQSWIMHAELCLAFGVWHRSKQSKTAQRNSGYYAVWVKGSKLCMKSSTSCKHKTHDWTCTQAAVSASTYVCNTHSRAHVTKPNTSKCMKWPTGVEKKEMQISCSSASHLHLDTALSICVSLFKELRRLSVWRHNPK